MAVCECLTKQFNKFYWIKVFNTKLRLEWVFNNCLQHFKTYIHQFRNVGCKTSQPKMIWKLLHSSNSSYTHHSTPFIIVLFNYFIFQINMYNTVHIFKLAVIHFVHLAWCKSNLYDLIVIGLQHINSRKSTKL